MTTTDSACLLDTNIIINLGDAVDPMSLPEIPLHVSTITLAELSAGVVAASADDERAARMRRLQWVESSFTSIPFDANAARFYSQIFARIRAQDRHPRCRLADLQVASIAGAHGWTLLTRNLPDFVGLDGLVTVTAV